MASVIEQAKMTTADMLALPENGVERWLIDGKLREKPMTVRNRFHSRTMMTIGISWNTGTGSSRCRAERLSEEKQDFGSLAHPIPPWDSTWPMHRQN